MGVEFLCCFPVGHNSSIPEYDLPSSIVGYIGLVGHKNNGNTLLNVQILEQFHNLRAGFCIQIAGRLIR